MVFFSPFTRPTIVNFYFYFLAKESQSVVVGAQCWSLVWFVVKWNCMWMTLWKPEFRHVDFVRRLSVFCLLIAKRFICWAQVTKWHFWGCSKDGWGLFDGGIYGWLFACFCSPCWFSRRFWSRWWCHVICCEATNMVEICLTRYGWVMDLVFVVRDWRGGMFVQIGEVWTWNYRISWFNYATPRVFMDFFKLISPKEAYCKLRSNLSIMTWLFNWNMICIKLPLCGSLFLAFFSVFSGIACNFWPKHFFSFS